VFVKRSNRLVILVGVLLAVLAFVAIVILLNQGGTDDPESEVPTTATVLVASRDIAIGDPVTPDVVETDEILVEAVRAGALRDPSEVSGEPALFAIPAGSQVTAAAIGRGRGDDICIECQLNPGEKAIAFQVDRVTGVDFLVRPGDSIDVVLSQQITVLQETADSAANPDENATPRFEAVTGLENQRTVKAILQNKRVLYVSSSRAITPEPTEDTNQDGVVDENDAPAEQASVDSVIIVFAGTNQDAEVIKFAQRDLGELGSLTAVIRSSDDDAEEVTLGVTIDQLVAEYGLRIPDIIEQLTEEAPAP
jgi:Flp pilus assembly protein CpaB